MAPAAGETVKKGATGGRADIEEPHAVLIWREYFPAAAYASKKPAATGAYGKRRPGQAKTEAKAKWPNRPPCTTRSGTIIWLTSSPTAPACSTSIATLSMR